MNLSEIKLKARQMKMAGLTREDVQAWASALPENNHDPEAAASAIESLYVGDAAIEPPATVMDADGNDDPLYHLTDMGNAERLIKRYGGLIRYCYERKMWLLWDGKHWAWDLGATIMKLAERTARAIYEEVAAEEDDDKRKHLATWAKDSEGSGRLEAMVKIAQASVPVKMSALDADGWLLNCSNGTINLRTGDLQPHKKEDYITMLIPTPYDPDAKSEVWETFLDQITAGKPEVKNYLQRAMGYSYTGDCREECFFFAHGLGQNGKSTFINAHSYVLGQYSCTPDPEIFLENRNPGKQGHNEDIANLAGKRMVIGAEIKEGRRLATTMMKQHTGGENITASRKHEHQFEFAVTYKIWLNANHRPDVTDTTYSIWRRVKLIPFNVTIPPEKRDEKLKSKLREPEHAKAILSWGVKGCREWVSRGLGEPSDVAQATASYRQEQDVLGEFFRARCHIDPNNAECVIKKKDLHAGYVQWCIDNSADAVPQRLFNKRVVEKGFPTFLSSGQTKWRYIRLKTQEEMEKDDGSTVDEVEQVDGNHGFFFYPRVSEKITVIPSTTSTSSTPNKPLFPDYACRNCGAEAQAFSPDGSHYICAECHWEYPSEVMP